MCPQVYHCKDTVSNSNILVLGGKGGGQKKTKKKVVTLLQPPSIYLPTPIGVQKATFLFFFQYFEMMF